MNILENLIIRIYRNSTPLSNQYSAESNKKDMLEAGVNILQKSDEYDWGFDFE